MVGGLIIITIITIIMKNNNNNLYHGYQCHKSGLQKGPQI